MTIITAADGRKGDSGTDERTDEDRSKQSTDGDHRRANRAGLIRGLDRGKCQHSEHRANGIDDDAFPLGDRRNASLGSNVS